MSIPKGIRVTTSIKYQKEFEDQIRQIGKDGGTPAIMADFIGISVVQLELWVKEKKGFREAFEVAMTASRAFHERRLIESYGNKDSNSTLIQTLLKANFPDHYQNATYQSIGTSSRKKQDGLDQIDFHAEISSLIDSLREPVTEPCGSMRNKKSGP